MKTALFKMTLKLYESDILENVQLANNIIFSNKLTDRQYHILHKALIECNKIKVDDPIFIMVTDNNNRIVYSIKELIKDENRKKMAKKPTSTNVG